jgi:hypothetical protein
MLNERTTLNLDISNLWFQSHSYHADPAHNDEPFSARFGDEFRFNTALIYRMYMNPEQRLRFDGLVELNYLHLGRDSEEGISELATGGQILYVMPGIRAYWNNLSFALGVKLPAWTDLNEEPDQQGGEGKENYRIIFSLSALF